MDLVLIPADGLEQEWFDSYGRKNFRLRRFRRISLDPVLFLVQLREF